jgi:tRNA (cytidine32/uridine32-2'-O)-methyltransferase
MKDRDGSPNRIRLPLHARVRFVLVRPHYPENLGACARALKTMGFWRLTLVRPGRLCHPEHEMAFKMAVRAWDVLDGAETVDELEAALTGVTEVVASTGRRGVSGVETPRSLAASLLERAETGAEIAILFGNEKTGLSADEQRLATRYLRIPMAASQPSINLAQAVVAALDRRGD